MFRIWAKIWKDHRLAGDITIEDASTQSRTRKVFSALETACHEFDLAVPIWLDSNIEEFKHTSKTRFAKDSFIEEISFDFLEIQVIEEDSSPN